MARLSRQAGEEGSERRRVEIEKREMQDKLQSAAAELEKTKQNLVNSEAKVYSSCIIFVRNIGRSTLYRFPISTNPVVVYVIFLFRYLWSSYS